MKSRIVGIVNQKGGVGKTVTALTLATGLAAGGSSVLLVDGDPQGNLTLFFTESAERGLSDVLKSLSSGGTVSSHEAPVIKNVRPGLDLVPMHDRSLRMELTDSDYRDVLPRYSEWLEDISKRYDAVITDCSPSNGWLEKTLVSACASVIVPLEFQLFSIAGLSALVEEIRDCSKLSGKTIKIEALVFTRVENRVNRVQEYRNAFKAYSIPIFEVAKTELVPKSLEIHKTLWEFAPQSFAARDYKAIIDRVFRT